jgi:capsular exopolysaccharide synthesis family protein
MGRLDNAMRRAAEERAARSSVDTFDPQDVLPEDFPSEEPAPPRPSAHFALPVTPAPPAAPVAPPAPALPAIPERTAAPVKPVEVYKTPEPVSDSPAPVPPPASPLPPSPVVEERSSLMQHVDARLSTKTVVDNNMLPTSREQYRRLAAALHQAQRANGFKVAMIASAVAGEGKTLTAANVALTLSESYRRNVLLVDGDLRRPTLHTVFQVAGSPGLSDGLISVEEPKLPLHRLSPRLTVLPAGRPTSDPIGALTSERMRRLIEEAREVFDWVIIDTPPIGLLTDAALLSSMADGVVLVVKAESTQCDLVNRAVDLIGRDRLLGVVLNRATEMPHRSSYDYSNYHYGATNELKAGRE